MAILHQRELQAAGAGLSENVRNRIVELQALGGQYVENCKGAQHELCQTLLPHTAAGWPASSCSDSSGS